MPQEPSIATSRSLTRRWRVPAHFLHNAERFEGSAMLDEIPGPLGVLLWQCERDVRLWGLAGNGGREHLFQPDAERRRMTALLASGAPADIHEPLRALSAALAHPAVCSAELVMLGCLRISRWAEAQGATATALTFAQAAALASPGSASTAYRVGKLARRRGEYGRAEGWLNRAVVLARQSRDRDTYARSYSGLGNLHLVRGNLPSAERYHLRALHLATRFHLHGLRGETLHDLFVVNAELNRSREALQFAAQALEAYGPRHRKLPTLAHDVAAFWLEQGHFARALPVLQAVWPRLDRHQQILGLANVARAAGAAGDRPLFERHWELALEHAAGGAAAGHPGALLDLARGAGSLGEWDRAETMARRALELATRLHEHKTRFAAETLLESLRGERRGAQAGRAAADPTADELALQLTRGLAGMAPTAPCP